MVTATWCNANVLNLFWIAIGASKAPFSLLPLTPLQGGNRPRAPTTQTRHTGHALVQWGSCGDHLVAGVNTRLCSAYMYSSTCNSGTSSFVDQYFSAAGAVSLLVDPAIFRCLRRAGHACSQRSLQFVYFMHHSSHGATWVRSPGALSPRSRSS